MIISFFNINYLISGEKSKPHAYPATMCPVKVFFRFILNLFSAENMTILLSILWQASHFWFRDGVTAGMECIDGSAIYFMSTGISLCKREEFIYQSYFSKIILYNKTIKQLYHSQTRRLLSSLVVTNLLFSSTNVIVFTAPKCLSYS